MSVGTTPNVEGVVTAVPPTTSSGRGGSSSTTRGQGRAGWMFVAPSLIIILLFLLLPVLASLWVSVSDRSGKGSPLGANFVGFKNYDALLGHTSLSQKNMGTAYRNIFYFVLLVVPLQTILALTLALILNRRRLHGKGFFRTTFYFPSVTSSVAIALVFMFLFQASGAINAILAWFGINGPNWFADPRGVGHLLLGAFGVHDAPSWLADHKFLSVTWWDWLAGPSIAMCAIIVLAIWTTGGTFMLMFLAALQDIPDDMLEAAKVDGATNWQSFRRVVVPALKPTFFLVITLGLIGTWQMFDQVFIISQGQPQNTTMTPAYLSYQASFINGKWGQGAAISFILFAVIIVFWLLQRFVMRDRKTVPRSHRIASWEKGK
jgi:multiple sugar transport system permease protein